MTEIAPNRDGVGGSLSVRLDSRTQNRLEALVEKFTEEDALGREANASQVVRAAIDGLYAEKLTLEGND